MKRLIAILIGLLLLLGAQANAQEQARIRVYRTQTFIADLMSFDISFNNSVVFRPAINTRGEFFVNPGKLKITAKGKKAVSITLQAEAGKIYYVRSNSSLKDNNVIIELLQMSEAEGEAEFTAITSEIVTQPQAEPVQLSAAQNVLSAIDSQHFMRNLEIGVFGGVGVRSGDIAYSYYLAQQPTPVCVDYGASLFMNVREALSVGAISSMQTVFTDNGPAYVFFTGVGVSTRLYLNVDQDAWIEGGILVGWQHAREQLPKQYGSTVMVPRFGNTIAPMGFVSFTQKMTNHLAFDAGIRMSICCFHRYSETDPDTHQTEKKKNYDYGLPPNMTIWRVNIGFKYIL